VAATLAQNRGVNDAAATVVIAKRRDNVPGQFAWCSVISAPVANVVQSMELSGT
jgi:hypothetical protein